MPLPKQEQTYSYEDYLTWPENERWEIIDGFAYMQATPTTFHQEITGGIFVQFYNYLKGKPCKVYIAPFAVRLPSRKEKNPSEISNVLEPDITVVCDKNKVDKKGCFGAPDLVVEVMSPSSAKIDRMIKFNKYEMAGVREYWIVEPDTRMVSVFTLDENQKYGRPNMYNDEDKIKVAIFPDFEVDLKEVFPEIDLTMQQEQEDQD